MTRGARICWWLAAVVVHCTLLVLFHLPEAKVPLGDERMYLRAAESVTAHGSSGLGSLWPPAYAWFLAPLVALDGGALWAVHAAQTALLLLAALLVRRLVRSETGDGWAAELAGLLMLTYPPLAAFAHYLWPEVLHLTLMLAALAWLLLGRAGWKTAVGGGLLLALCLQVKVLLLPLLAPLAVGLWLRWPRPQRWHAITLLATVAVGVVPTVLAQQRDFDRPMLANSGLFNVWVGLNDVSTSDFHNAVVAAEFRRYHQSARTPVARDRILREKIERVVRDRGVLATVSRQVRRQYFRLFSKDSFLTQQLVGGAVHARGDGYRAGDGTVARLVVHLSHASWAAVLLFAACGLAGFPYGRRPFGWWVLGFLLAQCALFLVLHVKTRYRIQMLPGLFFFAAYGASSLRQLLARRGGSLGGAAARLRWAGGLLLAALLLFLAFGG